MIPFGRNDNKLVFNGSRGVVSQLSDLGYTCTRAGTSARVWNSSTNLWETTVANEFRFSNHYGKMGLLVEQGQTNLVENSSDSIGWVGGGGTTTASATSCIDGGTAVTLTPAGTSSTWIEEDSDFIEVGVQSVYIIIEEGTSNQVDMLIRDVTNTTNICRARLTFATGVVSTISGTFTNPLAHKITDSGPNGNALWMFGFNFDDGTHDNVTGRISIYPDAVLGTGTVVWHHAQLCADGPITSPIYTSSGSAARAADVITSSTVPSAWGGDFYATANVGIAASDATGSAVFVLDDNAVNDAHGMVIANLGSGSIVGVATYNATTPTSTFAAGSAASSQDITLGTTIIAAGTTHRAGQSGTSGSGSPSALPTVTDIDLGSWQAAGGLYLNGCIYSLSFQRAFVGTDVLEAL